MPRDWKTSKCSESWRLSFKEDYLPKSVESDSDRAESDPEEAAERDYALQNGAPIVSAHHDEDHVLELEKKKPTVAKITQAKAARKARCRGVSGSMTKKQKDITNDDWDALYDDNYDFIEPDEPYDNTLNTLNGKNENHSNGLRLHDFAVKAGDAGFRHKKYTSKAVADAELGHHGSVGEPIGAQLIGGEIQVKANFQVADLKI